MPGAITGNAFGLAGRRAAGMPSKADQSSRTLVFDSGVLTTGTSITVPAGATYCEVDLGGAGGGGAGSGPDGVQAGSAGGGAFARHGFGVSPGASVGYAVGAAGAAASAGPINGGDGAPTTVSYLGSVIAKADGGKAGLRTPSVVNGLGGQITGSIGNIELRAGGAATAAFVGGILGPNALGVPPYTSVGGQPFASFPSQGTGFSAGGAGGKGGSTTSTNGAAGLAGFVHFRFYAS